MARERLLVRRAPNAASVLTHLWRMRSQKTLEIIAVCGSSSADPSRKGSTPAAIRTWPDAAPPGELPPLEAAEKMLRVGKSSRCQPCYEYAWRLVNGSKN